MYIVHVNVNCRARATILRLFDISASCGITCLFVYDVYLGYLVELRSI